MIRKNRVKTFTLQPTLILLASLLMAGCQKRVPEELLQKNNLSSAAQFTNQSGNLIVGINGHPLNTYAYNASSSTVAGVSYATQAAMIEQLGMTYYRFDISTNAAGQAVNHLKLLDMIAKCDAKNISILPMIYDRCDYNGTAQEAYDEAAHPAPGMPLQARTQWLSKQMIRTVLPKGMKRTIRARKVL